MKLNSVKLEEIILELLDDVKYSCVESSVFIGEIKGRPIQISVFKKSEAVDMHYYEGLEDKYTCLE